MQNRTMALIGAGLLLAALALGSLSSALAQTSGAPGGWGPGAMMGGYGPMHGPTVGQYGPMMGGNGPMDGGMMGGHGGMMGGWPGATGQATPLSSLAEARQAFQSYLVRVGNSDLTVDEVMEFERNYYAIVKQTSTGSNAFELLANKQNGAVFPEPGPNMIWNTQYGRMAGFASGMMTRGGMMGGQPAGGAGQATVNAERARELAQQWLDAYQPGSATETPDAFPGYYTVHITKDSTITGMLSVNAFSGQIWYHGWHGAFIAESKPQH